MNYPVRHETGTAPSAAEDGEIAAQVAGLCFRRSAGGKREVLLITSRDTGRWIIPKGWTMSGMSNAAAACEEAWEEAGVVDAAVKSRPLGAYHYPKVLDDGSIRPCRVEVFRIRVGKLAKSYPEARERKRIWVSPGKAAKLVDEPELKAILRDF